uniref:PolyVal ADP-ribosyltransferase n=1 Tax=Myoviridae sp. ctjz83 TaxID=2826083 RepID=A0A8D9UHE1_9CAUD|nr:MAG TPA: polyVal ADP-ribosyltransferase [Myoviridae sp. ctjz83]
MDRKTLEQNYQKSIGASLAAELEQNYQRSGIDSLVQAVKKATQYNPSAPSTQPTQAAPAGASSRKQSDAMREQLDAIKARRDDAAIKAGAYMRAGNMPQQAKEQQKIADKAAIEYENAYTQWKNQRNAEAVEDYNPDENKFKAGDAALAGVQNAFQSMRQYAAAASSYLSGNPEAQAWEAKRLMESGVSGAEAVKRAGLADKREIPITDYKTQAELRHEKNVASVGAVEGGALQLVNTISNMVPSLVANAVLPGSGLPVMAASAAGNKYADAYEKYGNTDTAFVLGSAAGGASMLTEQFGGLYGSLGKSAAGQAVAKKLMAEAPGLYNLANSVGGKWLRDALSEGIEEGAEDVINYAIEKALTGDSDEMDNFGYDILLGALAGGVLGGGNAAMRSVTYSRVGKALNASPAAVAQQVQEGMEKGAGTAPAIYAAEVQKNPSSQMVGRLYEANLTYDAESGLSKIQNDITQVSINEIKAMVSKADALAQAAQKLNVEATPQAVATAITDAKRTQSIKTAEGSVGQAFAPTVDNPANAGEKAYNSALAGVAANQGVAARINNDPAARQAFSQLTGVQFSGNTAQDIAAIEVATQNLAKSGKQAISQAEYAQRVAAAGEQAAAQFDADMQAQAEQMQRESDERWLSVEQNTITDVDGKRRIKEITNTDVRGNTEIGYKKAEILGSKKKAVAEVNNAAKYLGKTIVWFEGAVQVNGQYRLTNGYRAPDGTIYVNINSRDPLMVTFGHEMFHDLVADGKYSGMIDTLVENPDYADMVKGMMNAKTELYERNGIELDPDAAAEEVAADISGDLLGSRDMLEYIGARNTEAATGIKGFLNRILKKLKGKPSAQEAYNRLSESQKALLDGMEGRTEVEEAGKISYSLMREAVEKNNRPFAEQFADYKAGKMKPTELFALGNTSQYLQAAGIGNEPIVMAQSVVAKAQRKAKVDTHGHNLSDNVLLKLPEMLDKPALLLKSDTVPNAAVIVTSTADSDGNPVVVALHLSRSEGFDIVTRVASLYGKENSRDFLAEQMLRGNLLGYSKKEANRLLHRDGLQLPRRNTAVDFDTISVAQDTDAVNNYSMQNSAEDASGKHSLMDIPAMDSTGRELSAEQREYFKDSKVRDEDGNLLVVYHGTDADFTVFDASKGRANMDIQGMFFSPWELDAQGYGSNVSAYYLDIKNPASEAVGYKALNRFKGQNNAGVKAREYLQNLGYDGVNNENEEYIAFEPSQIKRIDNITPTSSQDIRYSLMDTDSTGRKLSAEQKKFFAGSKVIDGNGNLLVMYHGTTAFGYITKFKRGKKGWLGPGIYLTSKRSDAQRYADAMGEGNGRLYEMYANITKPLVVTDGNPVPGILKAAYGRDSVYKSRSEKQANDPSIVTQADINKLRAKGYDGIVWDYGGNKEVSVFSPEQVKLADNVDPTSSQDIRYSLMEDAQYMADIDKAVADAAQKANDDLKAAQAEVKNIRQQLADYRQQSTAEAKNTAAWKEGEAKLIADLSEAQSKEKKARALASYMDEYNAISERYRGEVRATDTEALAQYNEKLSNLRSGFRGEMEKLAIEQGAFKRGEKAARDIYVPTSVNGQKVTRGTRTILEASQTPESMLEEHAKEILAGARGYEVISDKKAQEYAERIIDKEGYDKADELFTNAVNGDQVLDKKTLVLGEYLYMEAAKAGDVKNAMRYAADVAAAATRAGQVVQAMRVLKKATPTGKLYYLNRMVDTMNKNIVDNGGDPIQIDEGLARKLLEAENIKDPKEQGKAVDETIDEIEQNIADQIPATAWDKWNAWRYLSMLGNIRTQVRNVVGNAAFMPLVATKNLLAAGMEKAFIRNGGRTKSAFFTKTNVGKRLMEFGKKDFETVVDEIQGGGKYNQSSSIEEKRTIFKSKAIEGWRKLTNKAMDKGDEIFSKHHYARALAGYLYANHLDYDKITRNTPQAQEVLNKARAYAILEAQKATFRDANQLAAFINKTKRNLLKKAQTAETKGAKVGWYAGTAIAEGIMPFTKTPIDILARGVEYSPIGLIKGIKEAVYDVKKGNKTAAEAIDTLSAGLTGTGIFALGYFLQSLGLLAGALDDDKESKYKKDRGAQGFAIHIGDKYYTIDWLAPFSLPLFTGAAVAETVENGDEVSFATLADVFSTISEPMLEMSMLQGVNSALSNGQYSSDSKIVSFMTNQITGYLSQANPTILGQIARAVDDTSRNAYYYDPNYKGFVQTGKVFGDKQIAKIPFASKALTSRIDLWGNKQENTGGSFFGRLAYNMLSPGYYSEESNDPVDVVLTKLYEETEDTAVLPSKPSKTVTNNKTDYKMNAKQYEEYCIVKGQTAHKEIQTFINSAEYKKMSNEDRVDVLEHLYKYSTYKAQKNLLGDKYVASSTYSRCVKAEAYAKGGNPVYKYFLKG